VSTTVVAQITGEPGVHLDYQTFVILTVREDAIRDVVDKATRRVSRSSFYEGDSTELRAELASELRVDGLTLLSIQFCEWVWFGE
jgi:hypothetical protein